MTDSYREQRPLLCDDYSDEEFDVKSYYHQRRNRPSIRSGRARNYARGAVAVITRWPDNCSTSLAYWWLGVSMIAIIIFVIYNSVLIFGMIPTSDMKQPKYRIFNNEMKPKVQTLSVPDVYMHLIINNSTDVILNKYLRYAKVILKKYPSFKYKFVIILNDTLKDYRDYKDEERNEIAFNSLWTNEKLNKNISHKYNISVEYISLTAYLNESPIKKFWRHLPSHLIEFLVRSVSIWEKGGVAFNPKILIPNLYNPHYIEKLYDIFNVYVNSSKSPVSKIKTGIYADVNTRRPNNIQDIINDLGTDDNNISNIDLSEAENNDSPVVAKTENILKFKQYSKYNSETGYNIKGNIKKDHQFIENDMVLNTKNHIISNYTNNTHITENILPLFLKYLYDNKSKNISPGVTTRIEMIKNNTALFETLKTLNQNQSSPIINILKPSMEQAEYNDTTTFSENLNKQMPVYNFPLLKMNKYDNIEELSLDIKGNIIASKTACHAFLGTMFSNVIQHTEEETLTDFIISELSLFCNGLLTSCAGVNIILV